MYENMDIMINEPHRLADAFTCIGDGVIVTDLGGCVVFMNEAAQSLSGVELAEVEGKHMGEAFLLFNINTAKSYEIPVDEIIQTGQKVVIEEDIFLITKNGSRLYLHGVCSPYINLAGETMGAVLYFRDITEVKNMKEEISANYNNFKAVFDTAPTGMVLVDTESRIKNINNVWKDIMSIDEMFPIGKRFGDGFCCIGSLMNGCGNGEKCILCTIRGSILRVLETGMPYFNIVLQHEFILNDKGFSPWLKTSFIPVTIKGEKCVLIMADDITEQKRQEEEVIQPVG
jgi:PAS domain S-box-containing protein